MKSTVKQEKTKLKKINKPVDKNKKISKTWLAVLANKGNGKILDMKAVLK